MSHCARLLDELAQEDPTLKSLLQEPGARPALAAAVTRASEPLFLLFGTPARVVYSDAVATWLGADHASTFGRILLDDLAGGRDPRDLVATALDRAGLAARLGGFAVLPIADGNDPHGAILCMPRGREAASALLPPDRQGAAGPEARLAAEPRHARTLSGVLDAIDQGCLIMNDRFEVVHANRRAAQIARLSPEQMLARTHWSLWPSSVDTAPGRMYRRVLETGRAEQLDHHYVGEGIDLWLRIHAYRVPDGLVTLFRDITPDIRRHNAEADHRARWTAARAAVETLWTLSAAGRMEGSQPGWEAVSGQRPDDYQGYGWLGAFHPEDAEGLSSALERAVMRRSRLEATARVQRRDGGWRAVRLRIVPVIRDGDHSLMEWVGVCDGVPGSLFA